MATVKRSEPIPPPPPPYTVSIELTQQEAEGLRTLLGHVTPAAQDHFSLADLLQKLKQVGVTSKMWCGPHGPSPTTGTIDLTREAYMALSKRDKL